MNGPGPQMYVSWPAYGADKRGQRRRTGQPLYRFQPVHDAQPVGVLRRQFAQGGAEDDGVLVAVGVDHHDLAAALGERRLADRHHRRDAAAGCQKQEVGVQRLGHEVARRGQDVDRASPGCALSHSQCDA